ncbi:hypothetical protein [Microbacterium sp. SA39]|uniref:hypothetical protein n=1 Tax=Microbacterium sp. SA39 TaxID=1263625 RepID=UPI00061E3230|nr:hypothetical protein [Microbacterium sp. SA39]KJQ55050.1 hypothetical protein RS85_01109 [Microbacterium sp. SA39]
MPEETEQTRAAELRALQRRAYGPGGGLTDAEARRLRELERAHRPVASTSAAREQPLPADEDPAGVDREQVPPSAAAREASETRETPETSHPGRFARLTRARRGGIVAAASALLLVIGAGAGWAIFGQRPEIVSLTADQQERQLALEEEGAFDDGSLEAVAEEEDALVWYATRDDGAQACLVIDIAQASAESCQDADDLERFGLSASVMVPPNAGSDAESGVAPGSSVNATMILSTEGEPMVSIQRWTSDLAMISQFQGTERDRAAELVENGFNAGLLLVGDFLSEPVWLGTRFVEGGGFVEYCMIVDGAGGRTVCTSEFDAAGRGVSTDVDGTVDGMPTTWNLRVQNTQNQTPYLLIAQTVGFPNPGDRMELGGEHGDPIEVTIPSQPEG